MMRTFTVTSHPCRTNTYHSFNVYRARCSSIKISPLFFLSVTLLCYCVIFNFNVDSLNIHVRMIVNCKIRKVVRSVKILSVLHQLTTFYKCFVSTWMGLYSEMKQWTECLESVSINIFKSWNVTLYMSLV
jgi:hypothetical protein